MARTSAHVDTHTMALRGLMGSSLWRIGVSRTLWQLRRTQILDKSSDAFDQLGRSLGKGARRHAAVRHALDEWRASWITGKDLALARQLGHVIHVFHARTNVFLVTDKVGGVAVAAIAEQERLDLLTLTPFDRQPSDPRFIRLHLGRGLLLNDGWSSWPFAFVVARAACAPEHDAPSRNAQGTPSQGSKPRLGAFG